MSGAQLGTRERQATCKKLESFGHQQDDSGLATRRANPGTPSPACRTPTNGVRTAGSACSLAGQACTAGTPVQPGSRVPNGTLIRVPLGTLIRVPLGTLIRVPLGTLIRVPFGTLIRVPLGTLIRVPLDNPPLGSSPEDWLFKAKQLYFEDTTKQFFFKRPWSLLRVLAKFKQLMAKATNGRCLHSIQPKTQLLSQKVEGSSDAALNTPSGIHSSKSNKYCERPPGFHNAKREIKEEEY
ncbi:hypothetical protein PCANC_25043 [Puccinia coronata f. sp. avenae]|uniref:Uncharacterized protein n=1 Tax=Puccinia coronata f. sp. avenae TaxID=200324 RepID=A0A2N5U1J8_9BASI|nr:hypothetical protein PCANC_25043 [Puccinia coronata f. sp. avenae]